MATKTPAEIADILVRLFSNDELVLFTGAGVGQHVGLPGWPQLLEHLASECEKAGDDAEATLIRQRTQRGLLAKAASIYKSSGSVPDGEKYRLLVSPFTRDFSDDELERVSDLVALPFAAFVTTNYDTLLHDAWAKLKGRAATTIDLGYPTMANLGLRRGFFIARIHGSVDNPTGVVIAEEDYVRLRSDDRYLDFLNVLFTQRPCLFVGFSFLDPAIDHVSKLVIELYGPDLPVLHHALLPESASPELLARLGEANIRAILYETSKAGHRPIWQAFNQARALLDQRGVVEGVTRTAHRAPYHAVLAFTYAQQHAGEEVRALRDLVEEGILLEVLQGEKGAPEGSLAAAVAKQLRVAEGDAAPIAERALSRLVASGRVQVNDGRLSVVGDAAGEEVLQALGMLSDGVVHRMRVREGVKLMPREGEVIPAVIEEVLLTRAYDLGAHYAGAAVGWAEDLKAVVRVVARRVSTAARVAVGSPEAMVNGVYSLFTSPEPDEAKLLATLGRAAVATQLAVSSPRSTLIHRGALPERVYLDANVLMPRITEGHPFRKAYAGALSTLRRGVERAGGVLVVRVAWPFLNEVVSHRTKAAELVAALGLSDPEALARHILFLGAENTNVYVAGYAAAVLREERQESFEQFLGRVAPYSDEEELAEFLKPLGIRRLESSVRETHNSLFAPLFGDLQTGYEAIRPFMEVRKDRVLIEHEAEQLTQLVVDQRAGLRSVLVSADTKLGKAIEVSPRLATLRDLRVSPLGLIGLVDLLVGAALDEESYARLVWSAGHHDGSEALREYLVTKALGEFEVAMALSLDTALAALMPEFEKEMKSEAIDLGSWATTAEAERNQRIVDRFENKFYKYMAEEMEKREDRG